MPNFLLSSLIILPTLTWVGNMANNMPSIRPDPARQSPKTYLIFFIDLFG